MINMKIGILYICIGKYKVFWKDFYLSCESFFISEAEKHYFVFTDSEEIEFESNNPRIHKIYQQNLGWPDNTLRRYEIFLKIEEKLKNFDYLFFFNADLHFFDKISALDFLPDKNQRLVACLHPGYFDKKVKNFPYEKNHESLAYVSNNDHKYYFAGGINGGKSVDFIAAMKTMNENIKKDFNNKIVAIWHDESHWNWYINTFLSTTKLLTPSFLYPETSILPFAKIIMIRDKRKYFNYNEIGKEELNNGKLQKLKTVIEQIGFIQCSTSWQVFKRWINRYKLLRTIYRNDKFRAIKNYFKNDLDYFKIKKEINNFKINSIYDFNGIKLPLSVITPDTFLNVIKPNVINIRYEPIEIENFYNSQRNLYKTLTYWKDNYLDKEPDYIGGHIISHGFTYFFNEIFIEEGDTVIDLGAAPGDFSAVCVQKGAAKVYAFEPEEKNSSNLKKVSKLNDNKIEIIRKYCGANTDVNSNRLSLDDFVKDNNISKINFIKADIEGAEVEALLGAKNILKNFQPKLSFCTYHSFDDEKNIEKAILSANPNYKIYKQKGVIYAF